MLGMKSRPIHNARNDPWFLSSFKSNLLLWDNKAQTFYKKIICFDMVMNEKIVRHPILLIAENVPRLFLFSA